jgi:hypothetical protein
MRPIVLPVISTLLFTGACLSAAPSRSAVSQVHVISVHVPDPAAFDKVFLLFRDVLQLPRVYGELSKSGNSDRRLYAGFSVGNAYLEPCGPYKDDAPFSPDRPARFHGLTFSPATTIADAAIALGNKSVSHSEVMGGGDLPRFVYLNDALLIGKKLAVSIWEIQNTNDNVNLSFLQSSLQEAKGGALGVKSIEEVRIGFPEKANLAQWGNFLSSAKHEGDVWFVGNGPALRFVPGKEMQVESIVLRVESLEKATKVLAQRQLVGKLTPDNVELAPARTWGLRIILRGK